MKKYAIFHWHFYMSISALTRQSHTGKSFPKKFFCKGVLLYFEISLLSFIHKNFEQNFYLYIITVYLVRIWTNKNADEKAHTFSRRSKNAKKRTKNGYCLNSPLVINFIAKYIRFIQARSQKFAMEGYSGGLGAEPPALENFAFFFQK